MFRPGRGQPLPFLFEEVKNVKKCIAFLLAVCLLVAPVLRPQRAAAVEPTLITVAGGAIGTGGLAGGAAVGATILPVLGVVGLTLAAAGVSVYIADQAAAEGMTRTEYIAQKITDFATATGSTADQVYNDLSGQLETTSDGNVIIGRVAADWISRFGDWLFSTDSVADSVGVPASPYLTISPCVFSRTGPNVEYTVTTDVSAFFFCCLNSNIKYVMCMSRYPFNWQCTGSNGAISTGSNTYTATIEGTVFYVAQIMYMSSYYLASFPATIYNGSTGNFLKGLTLDDLNITQSDNVFVGSQEEWTDNKDLLKPGEDDVTVLTPPDVLNPAGAAAGAGEYTISVPDYLTALADAYNTAGVADASIAVPLTNTATGVKEAVSVQAAAVDTSPSVAVDSDGFSGTSGLVDPEAEPSAENVVDAMRVDVRLQDVFPFSIPYNFFHLLEQFVGEAVVPQWDFVYTFPIGENGVPVDWHMDLTPYETWAVVIRWAVRVGWMATLASAAQRRIKF